MSKAQPSLLKFTVFQLKEMSGYCFDVSKLSIGALIVKLFGPEPELWIAADYGTFASGLIVALVFVILGLFFSRRIEK
ncbi:MAG: hypothetical protein AAB874_08280 [Patescibacteria group bacterium]|mgnify:CR=1 FL=1